MLYESARLSLYTQFITGAIDVWGLGIKVPVEKELFRTLLKIEVAVQAIEFIFYFWMVQNIKKYSNITKYRYFDWMITTPLMLLTLMAFLDSNKYNNLSDFIENNKTTIKQVLSLNFLMLYFGFLGETNKLSTNQSVFLGFIPFIMYYKIIYDKFVKPLKGENKNDTPTRPRGRSARSDEVAIDSEGDPNKLKIKIFFYFFIVWALYGASALFPYETKNIFYNFLDLFSKNFFGLFLVYIIYTNRIT